MGLFDKRDSEAVMEQYLNDLDFILEEILNDPHISTVKKNEITDLVMQLKEARGLERTLLATKLERLLK